MDGPPLGQSASATGVAGPELELLPITIRPLAALAEYQACVALQERVWGAGFSEAVPVSLLQAASHVGGLVVGAYDRGQHLVGFVFGLTGVQDGRTLHWSHLLGVDGTARNLGVGRMLKEYQRAELARRGIDEMRWTFDPLIAKNAHLNLNLLGARVVRFAPNMYGTTTTPLHHGLPTDRFVVSWSTTGAAAPRPAASSAPDGAPLLTLEPRPGDEVADTRHRPPRLRLEVPTDFQALMTRAPARAMEWHAAVRGHLQWALGNDYVVTGLHRDALSLRSFYLLATTPPSA